MTFFAFLLLQEHFTILLMPAPSEPYTRCEQNHILENMIAVRSEGSLIEQNALTLPSCTGIYSKSPGIVLSEI